jgi:hypothetical protein
VKKEIREGHLKDVAPDDGKDDGQKDDDASHGENCKKSNEMNN